MDVLIVPLALVATFSLLTGYLRFIVDDQGNVPLLQYRLTGCLGAVCRGMYGGSRDLLGRDRTPDAVSAALVYSGLGLFLLVFSGALGTA